MSNLTDLSRLSAAQFAARFHAELVPLSNKFSYFFAGVARTEDDLREYLEEPVEALPPAVLQLLPPVAVFLVPFLEKTNGREKSGERGTHEFVCLEKPADSRQCWDVMMTTPAEACLLFAVNDQEVSEYHYRFYRLLATLVTQVWHPDDQSQYGSLLREELSNNIHGEVDEASWRLKQVLRRRQTNLRRDSKGFRGYLRQSFIDTMTLYLHGICCDIDVETGPRQLPSRYLRRRLQLLEELYPPPGGYCVFPEELHGTEERGCAT